MIVGVAVEPGHVRAVAVRRGRVMWGVEHVIDPSVPLADALAAFLRALPVPRWPRPSITAAFGLAFAQTKRLAGLPPIVDARLLAQTVREHADRFFLKNGVPLATTTVRVDAPGEAWAAALDQTVVVALDTACRAARLRLRAVVPAADVLGRGLELAADGSVLWGEPGARGMVTWTNGRLAALVRVTDAEHTTAAAPAAVPALAVLGANAWRFAAAYAAARVGDRSVPESSVLSWSGRAAAAETTRRRIAIAAGAASVALVAARCSRPVSGPGAPSDARRTAWRRSPSHVARPNERRAMSRRSRALGEMAAFGAGTQPVTLLLAALARTLPAGAALVAVHVDSAGGSLVALTPRAGEWLRRVETVPGIISPEIVSPVTRDASGGRDVERATIRFRWGRP